MKLSGKFFIVATMATLALLIAGCVVAPTNQTPLAVFTTSPNSGDAPLAVAFDADGSSDPDGTVVAYNWDFGDFTTGSGSAVNHSFGAGQYTVTLTVTDDAGATASSTSVISVTGVPVAPTGLTKTGSGCCDTYGDFSWNAVAGATAYQVSMDGFFGGGCLTDHSANFPAPATSGRVQAIGLCLGSKYDVSIRAQANGQWGPWSPSIRITL